MVRRSNKENRRHWFVLTASVSAVNLKNEHPKPRQKLSPLVSSDLKPSVEFIVETSLWRRSSHDL